MLRRIILLIFIVAGAFSTLGFALQLGMQTESASVPLNTAPQLAPVYLSISEDAPYATQVVASDADLTNTLTFVIDGGPISADFSPLSGSVDASGLLTTTLYVTPTEANGPASYPITVTVTDDDVPANTITTTFVITVNEVNITPTIGTIADLSTDELVPITVTIPISDADLPANVLTITTPSPLPTGASIVSETLIWTPSEAQGPGVYSVTLGVTDGALTATETFTVFVAEDNQPPTIEQMSNRLITETVPISFTLIVTDTDIPTVLTFTMSSQPTSTATIDGGSGQFDWTPTEADGGITYTMQISVTDGSSTASTSGYIYVVETNLTPTLSTSDQMITETMQLSFTLNGVDPDLPGDMLTYTIEASSTTTAQLDPSSGLFQWTPTELQGGQQFTVTAMVSDGQLAATDTFTITVIEVNTAPTINPIVAQQITETHRLTFTLTATDTDDPPDSALTITLASITPAVGTSPLFTSATGMFDWTPIEVDGPNLFTATFMVTDGGLTSTLEVPIDVLESNLAPTFVTIPSQVITESTLLSLTLVVTDPDLPANSFSYVIDSSVPTSAMISSTTGIFNWIPDDALGGSVVTFTITVSDGSLTATQTFTVSVIESSVPPVLADATVQISETVQLQFMVPGSDIDNPPDILTYTLVASTTDSAQLDPSSGLFTWTPTEAQGSYNFTATISLFDGTFTVTKTYTITVIDTNVAPSFLPMAAQQITETVQLTFTLSFTDADLPADSLMITLGANAPAGATVNPTTGEFSWTPAEADGPGTTTVTFIVSDGVLTDTIDVPITVFESNQAPTLPATMYFTITETTPFSVVISAVDGDVPTNTLTYRPVSYLPSGATFITDTLYWTPDELAGSHGFQVTVEVSDGLETAVTTLIFTVLESNTAPVIAPIAEQQIAPNSRLELTAVATDSDVPVDTLTYGLLNPPAGATIHPATGMFTWTSVPSGTHVVTVTVTDNGVPPLSSSRQFTVSTGIFRIFVPVILRDYSPLFNGGFESGTLDGWQTSGEIRSGVSTVQDIDGSFGTTTLSPISGTYSAHLGDPAYGTNGAPVGFGELRHTISLPNDATKVKLQYRILTHDRIFVHTSSRYFDTFEVYINSETAIDSVRNDRCLDNRGNVGPISNNLVLCDGNPASATRNTPPANMGLQSAEIDISALAGTNIELILRVYNRVDSSYNTWVYLDEIEVVNN